MKKEELETIQAAGSAIENHMIDVMLQHSECQEMSVATLLFIAGTARRLSFSAMEKILEETRS